MNGLPANASETSRQLYGIAQQFIRAMPLPAGSEAALTGSVARCAADRFSDIEIMVWGETIPTAEECETLLRAAGARVDPDTEEWMGAITTKSWLDGIFIEVAWHTQANLERQMDAVRSGETLDHWDQVWAWHIVHNVPLNDTPELRRQKEKLSHYPDNLQTALIENGTLAWSSPHWHPLSPVNTTVLAERGAQMALAARLNRELERTLRVLFALNRQWEPDYKWIAGESKRLLTKPHNLLERIDAVFTLSDPRERLERCFRLILDTLLLVPAHFDVSLALRHVEEALNIEALLGRRGETREPETTST